MLVLRTKRLDIVAATADHLRAELESAAQLEKLLGAALPPVWPPGEYDRSAIEFFRDRLEEAPDFAGWLTWYAIERASSDRAALVVGAGGYFGPPSDGHVEIGYSIAEGFRGRGFATELVGALLARALLEPGVRRVTARTQSDNRASIRVLERCGFLFAGAGEAAGSARYIFERPASR
jgi:[ribosomal protein S5]-alanine N-acetyltransferase